MAAFVNIRMLREARHPLFLGKELYEIRQIFKGFPVNKKKDSCQ